MAEVPAPAKRRARWGLILAVAAIALVAVLAGTATYLSSEAALRRLLAYAVAQSDGRLTIEEARGSLLGRMELARLLYRDGDASVTLEGVTIDHAPRSLVDRRLTITNLSVRQMTVELAPGDYWYMAAGRCVMACSGNASRSAAVSSSGGYQKGSGSKYVRMRSR